ncbi:MAG TPA: type VI secretion system tube protein Hcp [Bryobacteraceae bacterium]|nr:type VI secretion system tube protein Hcp [Bryobacteraceae bacterium]
MLLQIEGVEGESQIQGKSGWIDILSYSLGASNPSSVATGMGSGAGKVSVSSLSVQKVIDKATPILFLKCCSGKHFDKAKLVVREAGDKPLEYLILTFEQVYVDNISWGGAAGGGKPTESISLSFAKITIEYAPQKADGTLGEPVPSGWDIQQNVAAA